MSNLGRSNNKIDTRLIVLMLQLKIMIGLFLFKKIEIEIGERNYHVEKALQDWCKNNRFCISFKDEKHQVVLSGHSIHYTDSYKICRVITVSK